MSERVYPYQQLYLIVIMIIGCIIYIYTFDSKLHMGGDNANYFSLAKGFAELKGYVSMMSPAETPATHYPPGYPFILSIPMMMGFSNVILLKLINFAFYLGSIWLTYNLSRELSNDSLFALLCSTFLAINYHILNYSFIIMSEMPYTFFSLLAVYAVYRYSTTDDKSLKYIFIATFAAVIAYFIRSLGIAIVIAMLIYLVFNKDWKATAVSLASIVAFILPWQWRMSQLGGGGYKSQLMQVNPYRPSLGVMDTAEKWLRRIGTNMDRYFAKEFSSALINPVDWGPNVEVQAWMYILGIGLFLLGIFGIYKLSGAIKGFILLFLMGHFGILLLWPDVWYGVRFMLSLVPIMYLIMFYGLFAIFSEKLSLSNHLIWMAPMLLLWLLISSPSLNRLNTLSKSPYPKVYQDYFDLAKACKTQLPDSALVACRKTGFFYMFSEKKVTKYTYTKDDKALIQNLRERGVTHVVVDRLGFSSTPLYLIPAIKKNPSNFKLLAQKEGSNTILYEFIP